MDTIPFCSANIHRVGVWVLGGGGLVWMHLVTRIWPLDELRAVRYPTLLD